jgi:hypothetical protein
MKHAAPEEVVAFRDGEPLDREVERHIRACPFCRRQLGEARWVRAHTQSHRLEAHGPDPTRDEIAAYLDEALDQEEMARVESHIRSSDRHLASFEKLLTLSMALEDPLPGPEQVEELKAKLREPKRLGKLRVFITDRFKQVFHPARPGAPAPSRAIRLAAASDGLLPCMEASVDCAKFLMDTSANCDTSPPPPPGPSRPRVIDTGGWLIRAVTSGAMGDVLLELTVEEAESGQPQPEIPVKLVPEWDDPISARTDRKGSVRLPLTDGDSLLEIGEGPRMVLEIDASLSSPQH